MISLSADNLVKAYKKRKVVDKVSLEVNKGEIVGLLGPNGAGKTTTFYMITGIVKPDSGEVMCADQDITNLPMYKRADMGIGYLAQEPSVFRNLTVEENIEVVEDIQNIIRHLKKRGLGILITDHNVRETLSITDKSYIMAKGRVLIEGTPREIANNPEAKRIYLGEKFRLD